MLAFEYLNFTLGLECAIKENEDIVPMTLPGKSVDEMQLELNY